jgi:hypothetical protein
MTTDAEIKTGNEFQEYLEGEIALAEKKNRMTIIVGALMLVIIGGYMTFIGSFVRNEVLNPKTAAQWVSYMTQQNLPVILVQTEATLKEQAPTAADQMVGSLLQVPTLVGNEARKQIDFVVDEMLPQMETELDSTVQSYFDAHVDDAAEFFAEHHEPGMAEAFIDQLSEDLVADLDQHMIRDGGKGVHHLVDVSMGALEAINRRVETLATKDPADMTREELLHKELVVLCLHVLDDLLIEAQASGDPLFDGDATLQL